MNFLEFVQKQNINNDNKKIIKEGFKNSDLGKAQKLIIDLLRKQTGEIVVSLGNFDLEVDDAECTSELFVLANKNNPICFTFNWLNEGKSSQVYSISFFKNMNVFFDGHGKADLTIDTLGSSIVYFLPLIAYIISTGDLDLQKNDATKFIKGIFGVSESYKYDCYIGALKYSVIGGIKGNIIKETFLYNLKNNVFEGKYGDLVKWVDKKFYALNDARKHQNDSKEDKEIFKKLEDEYTEIQNAIKGGATSIEQVELVLQKSVQVKVVPSKDEIKLQKELDNSKKDPEQVFKEMSKYIKMVIKGITPSVILCGAPGVGKTFRVKKELKEGGYIEGQNLYTIKGKCSPRVLYLQLTKFKEKGQIILIDDADGLVGPKAPEDVINILKAALDSTSEPEGRLVSYGVSGPLKDENGKDVPKKFYYNGSVIVITNYNAGQLDTALRGRSFIQDIHFSVEEVLEIIKKLMPNLEADSLSPTAKINAYEFLVELANKKSEMEISLRTFVICAKIFEACTSDDNFDIEDAKSMVQEQMRLQYLRGGKSY